MLPILVLPMLDQSSILADARSLTAEVQARFWQAERNEYAAYITESGGIAKEPAFAWDMSAQLSALAAAVRVNRAEYQPLFDRAQASLDTYGSDYNGIFGYGVLPDQKEPDRFYDDNEWIVLAQLDAYEATNEKKYLADAKKTFRFAMSGFSPDLGGGIFWREKEKTSKNTCSNAPAILAAAKLYQGTKDSRYLRTAENLHRWAENLKDPVDHLMFDSMALDGHIDKMKWTYNTALMISGDVALYNITGSPEYRDEALAMGQAAIKHWVDPETGAIHDEGPFACHLAEGFFELSTLEPSGPWKTISERAISYAYDNTRQGGLFGLRWDRYEARYHRVILLYQASMARALWDAASFLGHHWKPPVTWKQKNKLEH